MAFPYGNSKTIIIDAERFWIIAYTALPKKKDTADKMTEKISRSSTRHPCLTAPVRLECKDELQSHPILVGGSVSPNFSRRH